MVRRGSWMMAAAGWGIAAGWWTPRGPLTITQALWSVVVSVLVGALAGWLSRSRRPMLVAPVLFTVAVEVLRLRVDGPSVDGPHPSAFGLIALLAGRGVQGLLTVLPMVLAAAYGAGFAARGTRTGTFRYVRRTVVGLLTALLLAGTAAVAVPARTAPTAGPRSVAELTAVDAGGHSLGLMIRGTDTARPVLLFVPGAPGGSERGAVRRHLAALEQRFVVATLDRRGGGSSYPALDPTATVTLDGAVADTVAVTDYLRRRFHQEKIYLLGHSGGSIISVLAVQRRPELYRAYIGTGQAVDLAASDKIFYVDILAWARATGHDAVVRQMTALGPPPYRDVYSYEPIMLNENAAYDYPGAADPFGEVDVPESTLLEKAHTVNAVLDTWSALYPRMQQVDLRRDVPRLAVPVHFVQGGHEMRGLADLFTPWYSRLQAPSKHLTVVPAGGHRAVFEHPDQLAAVLDQVLAETSGPNGR